MGVLKTSDNILTPEFRVSFPDVFKPNTYGGKEKFQITMLFSKEQDLSTLKELVKGAVLATWPSGTERPPLELPFKDGDQKDYDGYEGHIFIRAGSNYPPGVVDAHREDIISPTDFYGGCYARAQVNAYVWEFGGKHGVSFGLQNVQKLRDGDPFGSRARPSDAFDDGYAAPEGFENTQDDIFNDPTAPDDLDSL